MTPDQIIALSRATEQSDGVHLIDFRASTSLFYRPLYLRVLVGDERRSKERLGNEKQLGAVKTAFVVAMLGWVVTTVTLIILIVAVNFLEPPWVSMFSILRHFSGTASWIDSRPMRLDRRFVPS